jgi:hypothetical protein
MADEVIKKAIIPKSSLPAINSNTAGYSVRYRIVSEDKNRTSHWSPIFDTNAVAIESVNGALLIGETIITAVWEDGSPIYDVVPLDLISRPRYDVFVKFDSGSFSYHGTSAVHSYSFLNTGTTSVHVKIQIASSVKQVKTALVIFDSGVESLV